MVAEIRVKGVLFRRLRNLPRIKVLVHFALAWIKSLPEPEQILLLACLPNQCL